MAVQGGASSPRDLHFSIDHAAKRELLRVLREVPDLAEDLLDTRTRQTRFGAVDFRTRSGAIEQRLPFNEAAVKVEGHLRTVLSTWTRLVCEERAIDYTGADTLSALAQWLERNIVALALTPGAECALDDIRTAVEAAAFVVCPPAQPTVDAELVRRARAVRLNVTGIGELAGQLGAEYRNLTPRRVRTLREAGLIEPVPGPWAPDWPELFVVGEVLDAHLSMPSRRRTTGC